MALPPPKTCPSCRVEYLHTAEICADCDVALVSGPLPEPEDDAGASLPSTDELALVLRDQPWELERMAQVLASADLRARIDRVGERELGLYVLPSDRAAALLVVHEYRAATLHDAEAGAIGEALTACPTCQTDLHPAATSCPECGLEFPSTLGACPHCGAEVNADDTSCLGCGASLEDPEAR